MTRPRSTYVYADQSVRSPAGTLELCSIGKRIVLRDPSDRWSVELRVAPKQLFVADDGRAAVVGADDGLTFYDTRGEVTASMSLLELVDDELVSFGTAGQSWDDYLAGSFGDGLFVLDPNSGHQAGRIQAPNSGHQAGRTQAPNWPHSGDQATSGGQNSGGKAARLGPESCRVMCRRSRLSAVGVHRAGRSRPWTADSRRVGQPDHLELRLAREAYRPT